MTRFDHQVRERLVSVIVPMYNVEAYIAFCIDSIRQQSFRDLEIILVDDGSPDESGRIADASAMQDDRIRVIHQQNSGVSAARNAGLDAASGEFVCFVDGDDWLAPDFVGHFVDLATAHDADMVLSTRVLYKVGPSSQSQLTEVWSAERATAELLYGEIRIGCWNKLFRRASVEQHTLRFSPRYVMGEGLNFITTASQLARRVVATGHASYFYRRDNATSATTTLSLGKMENALDAIQNIRDQLLVDVPAVRAALCFHEAMAAFATLRVAYGSGNARQRPDLVTRCLLAVRNLRPSLIATARVPVTRKLKALVILLAPRLAARLVARPHEPTMVVSRRR